MLHGLSGHPTLAKVLLGVNLNLLGIVQHDLEIPTNRQHGGAS